MRHRDKSEIINIKTMETEKSTQKNRILIPPVTKRFMSCTFSLLFFSILSIAQIQDAILIFEDNFNDTSSYYPTLTKNATCQEYTNCDEYGYLLKKWIYNWDYKPSGDWTQAFYCVPPFTTYMAQNGRSSGHEYFYKVLANVAVPETAKKYIITFRQYKNDNDRVFYLFGTDIKGNNGVEIGYQNQIPGTDTNTSYATIVGDINSGAQIPNAAAHKVWVTVRIEVDVEKKLVKWTQGNTIMVEGTAPHLKPGGYFAINMRSERRTRFDDFKIYAIENTTSTVNLRKNEKVKIFPNPTNNGFIEVHFRNNPKFALASLVNLSGKKIAEYYLVCKENTIILPEVPNGIYMMQIETEKEYYIEKIQVLK